jgi:sterol desaturase/sphingolipid hydroxylase (fatty acid hydroxylase superfamily)
MRSIFRNGFYPAFVFSALIGHLALIRAYPAMHPTLLASGVIVPAVVLVMALEQIIPYRKTWNRIDSDFWTDLLLTNLIFPVLVEGVSFLLKYGFGDGVLSIWPVHAPIFAQLILALIIGEFFFYWAHRLGHETEVLWKFHRTHHVSRRVYWMNAARFHPVDLLLNFVLYFMPLAILGAPTEVFALVFSVNAATGLLEHANIDFDAGWLNRIFNTAQLHRWHHSVDIAISQQNYGKVLSIWDQVFRTYYLPQNKHVGHVGVDEPLVLVKTPIVSDVLSGVE